MIAQVVAAAGGTLRAGCSLGRVVRARLAAWRDREQCPTRLNGCRCARGRGHGAAHMFHFESGTVMQDGHKQWVIKA